MDACANCQKTQQEAGRLLLCSACETARYCSKECQKAAWKAHKPMCEQLSAKRQPTEEELSARSRERAQGIHRNAQGKIIVPRDPVTGLVKDVFGPIAQAEKLERMKMSEDYPRCRPTLSEDIEDRRHLGGHLFRTIQGRDAPFPPNRICPHCKYPPVFKKRCACEYCICKGFGEKKCDCGAAKRIYSAVKIDEWISDMEYDPSIRWEYRYDNNPTGRKAKWKRFDLELERTIESLYTMGSPHVLFDPFNPAAEGKYIEQIHIPKGSPPPPGVATHRITFSDMMCRDMFGGVGIRTLKGANPIRRRGPTPKKHPMREIAQLFVQ